MAYQTAVANKTDCVFLNGSRSGSPRKSAARKPPAKVTIIVDNQQAIGCFRENGMDPARNKAKKK